MMQFLYMINQTTAFGIPFDSYSFMNHYNNYKKEHVIEIFIIKHQMRIMK